jgi:hypothetical protein
MLLGAKVKVFAFFAKLLLVVATWLATVLTVSGQQANLLLQPHVLNNPVANSAWFDTSIPIDSVPSYSLPTKENHYCITFGYAKSVIKNDVSHIKMRIANEQPVAVDIVFTGYPIRKDDWITNYYTLLAERIKALIELDERLNSADISWRLVIQTEGKIASQAEAMFHGAFISTTSTVPSKLARLPVPYFYAENTNDVLLFNKAEDIVEQTLLSDKELEAILYPKSIYTRSVNATMPARSKSKDEPDCPNFRTRMQKPKENIWRRIFR